MNKNNKIAVLKVIDAKTNIFTNGDKYVIPLYQRAFAWTDKEIVQMIDDVLDIEEDSAYYLGSLIVSEQENFFEVIDGQQRLTALYLLMNQLEVVDVKDEETPLSFACREKSNYTLKNIRDITGEYGDLNAAYTSEPEKRAESIIAGFKTIRQKLEGLSAADVDRLKDNLKRVTLYRIPVPENTNLNRYFEIMNTRGEQLEQPDILKAALMGNIDNPSERGKFALIWNAVSDMTGYVQMHFDVSKRKELFGPYWNDFPDANNININKMSGDNESKGNGKSIKDLGDPGFSAGEISEERATGDKERFESIIEFPYFLLHALKVYVKRHKIKDAEGKDFDIQLDDKKLTAAFDKVMEDGLIENEKIDKDKFARSFIRELLQYRYLFDKYIIKREYTTSSQDGHWSLKEFWGAGKDKHAYYTDTPLKKSRENNRTYKKRKEPAIMLQSCLRVSYTSPRVMHWITDLMDWLYENRTKDNLIPPEEYLGRTEDIAKEAVRNQIQKREDLNQGVKTPHIVFNYLDYLLWYKNQKQSFTFEFRNSVEHWYPQNPSEGGIEKWDDVDRFGNLCIIQRNINSRFSNMAPEAKKTTFDSMIEKGSFKLRKMAAATEAGKDNRESASQRWKKELCEEHENEMVKILERACGISLADSVKKENEVADADGVRDDEKVL